MNNDNISVKLIQLLSDMAHSSGIVLEKLSQIQGYTSTNIEIKNIIDQLHEDFTCLSRNVKNITELLNNRDKECPGYDYIKEITDKKNDFVEIIKDAINKIEELNMTIIKSIILPKAVIYALCGSVIMNVILLIPKAEKYMYDLFK
jgi:hypothetical protein